MTRSFLQQDDILNSCIALKEKTTTTYNSTDMRYTSTPYYENNTTLRSINFKEHDSAIAYFKSVTSSIAKHCSTDNSTLFDPRFNTTETLNEIATNLTHIYVYDNAILCTQTYRKVGIEMMDYACNNAQESTLDNFYLDFTHAAKMEALGLASTECCE